MAFEIRSARAQHVEITDDTPSVDLSDGRKNSVALGLYPRLRHGTPEGRKNWRLIGQGQGIHWPDLGEDSSVEELISGEPSGESQESLKEWQEGRHSRDA